MVAQGQDRGFCKWRQPKPPPQEVDLSIGGGVGVAWAGLTEQELGGRQASLLEGAGDMQSFSVAFHWAKSNEEEGVSGWGTVDTS